MDRSNAENIIADYDKLLARALKILDGSGPPWGFVWTPEWARIQFDGDEVVISCPKAESYYDSTTIECEETRFPSALLFMSEAELLEWKRQARTEYEAAQKRIEAERRLQSERAERAEFDRLKAKFGRA